VSPLRIDDAERPLLGDRAALWIGAAGLLLVGGSVVLVLTRRR
jgi:LPXTG-motif cell wall-anchored protein